MTRTWKRVQSCDVIGCLETDVRPATQYFPETLRFRLTAIFPATIYTTNDVTCHLFLAKVLKQSAQL